MPQIKKAASDMKILDEKGEEIKKGTFLIK